MKHKSYLHKGPRPTARDYADQRERVERMTDFTARDNAELADYAVAVSVGDWETANRISRERYQRSRLIFDRPLGVPDSEAKRSEISSGQATGHPSGEGTALTAPPSVLTESFGVRYFDQQLKALVRKVRTLIPDR